MADRRSSGEDGDLWRAVTSEVTPLRKRKSRTKPAPSQASPQAAKPPETEFADPSERSSTIGAKPAVRRPDPSFSPLSANTVSGVDKRTVARLRRGQLPIDARIDLHGFTQREAHRELADFLEDAHEERRRTVLVITGKGEGGQGVLREAVPRWINEAALRPLVLAFVQAQPKDGGAGAYYVLLRRKR